MLEKAEKLVDEAEGIADKSAADFDALDVMKKIKAVAMTAKNVAACAKIPKAIKDSVTATKEELT